MNKEFVGEASNKQKKEIFFITLLVVIVVSAIVVVAMTFFRTGIASSPSFQGVKHFFEKDIKAASPLGLFYMSFLGNLMFVPLPVELPFYIGLGKGNPFFLSLFLVLAGLIPSHALNYVIGTKFSSMVFTFISTKKIYKTKRWVNSFGPYAILGFNLLPLPSNELTFALGIAKYNVTRLFVFTLLGTVLKFFAMWGFFAIF